MPDALALPKSGACAPQCPQLSIGVEYLAADSDALIQETELAEFPAAQAPLVPTPLDQEGAALRLRLVLCQATRHPPQARLLRLQSRARRKYWAPPGRSSIRPSGKARRPRFSIDPRRS